MSGRDRAVAVIACCAILASAAAAPAASPGYAAPRARPFTDRCRPPALGPAMPALEPTDVWRYNTAYPYPFPGWTPKGVGTVLWKKFAGGPRKTHYPAPNLPSCRVGLRGTEDRSGHKVGRNLESLLPIDGLRSYDVLDSFGRVITTIHWQDASLIHRHPERWGWYVGDKWAGHDATRAFEVQGGACKFALLAETTVSGEPPAPVTTYRWARDENYVMIAFNPANGSPGGAARPHRTSALRVRGFVDRRALPDWAIELAGTYDFGCGASDLTPFLEPQILPSFKFTSGYGPGRQYLIGQYFGESASQLVPLPGEKQVRNNMPYSTYNPKPQFANATYAMVNTTGVAAGGMVRGIVRAGADELTLYDQMRYCDPNFTLRGLVLRRNGRRVSKWNYFTPADVSKRNTPSVRWVFGEIHPGAAGDSVEAAKASANPASERLFAWLPIYCDR